MLCPAHRTVDRSTAARLQAYLRIRERHGPDGPATALFLDRRGQRLSYEQASETFRGLRRRANLGTAAVKPPRLHDLRHTYACNCLQKWRREGADLKAKLPVLATAMGHTKIEHTQIYLHVTPAQLREASERLRNHLASERNVSTNTIASYSDCVRLLLDYACATLETTIDKLAIDAISDAMVLDFLDHLESRRGNVPATRNQRLGAIKTFFRFLARQEPTLVAVCERVCAIRTKETQQKLFQTLQIDETEAVLQAPDSDTLQGARDAVLLAMLYNTGARAQELVDLDLNDLRLDGPAQATLTGKGRKQRIAPIWTETANAISHYLELRQQAGIHSEKLLLNARGQRITRFGINYTIAKHVSRAAQQCPSLQNKHVTAHTFRHCRPVRGQSLYLHLAAAARPLNANTRTGP